MGQDNIRDRLVAQADRTKQILRTGSYGTARGTVDLQPLLAASLAGNRLVRPHEWPEILREATARCTHSSPAPLAVTSESTLAAIARLAGAGMTSVAALNFASARRPGGGWDTGARAQEESIARASGLIRGLEAAPDYYAANRRQHHLFYTDHAIWTPSVPVFANDDGELLETPLAVGMITMPAPNIGAMHPPTPSDLEALPGVWRQRIRCVLALAIVQQVQHLILGAWGCGAFGNDPQLVAGYFRDVLADGEPWRNGFESLTFAIYDKSKGQACLQAFTSTFQSPEQP